MNLAAAGQLDLLKRLYDKVTVPNMVAQELSAIHTERFHVPSLETLSWIEVKAVADRYLVSSFLLKLDPGEAEVIALAVEMNADLVLLDERMAREVASRLGLKFIGVIGVLIEAKHRGFILTLKPVLDDMIAKAGFWVSEHLYARVLREAGE
jgi:predicted nucleic acid-binding protein